MPFFREIYNKKSADVGPGSNPGSNPENASNDAVLARNFFCFQVLLNDDVSASIFYLF